MFIVFTQYPFYCVHCNVQLTRFLSLSRVFRIALTSGLHVTAVTAKVCNCKLYIDLQGVITV